MTMGKVEEILERIHASGGSGLVNYTPPGSERSYQLVILGKQVVAVVLNGEYQPRMSGGEGGPGTHGG